MVWCRALSQKSKAQEEKAEGDAHAKTEQGFQACRHSTDTCPEPPSPKEEASPELSSEGNTSKGRDPQHGLESWT